MTLFVTGATGFLGRRFLQALDAARLGPVLCLARTPSALPPSVRAVEGDLLEPSSYRAALAGCDTVVHLAAVTGKASLAEHRRVNAEGTRVLLEACREAGVGRFVHVSTIAVTYPDLGAYAYAISKAEAETHVRASGLDWAIVRPTVVLGPGSPLAGKFRALAAGPLLIVPGTGLVRMNPVHVGDVAECLEWLARCEPLGRRTFGFGGRDVLTVEEFERRIRAALGGRDGPVVRVPLRPIVAALAPLQKIALPLLPVTTGQFYTFLHDSVPAPAEGIVPAVPDRRGADDIIADQWGRRAAAAPPDAQGTEALAAEADAFCKYLVGRAPSDYVRRKYVEAHAGSGSPVRGPSFDDFLVAYARRGPARARLADAYAAAFSRSGTFRRKLVLMLAILESSAETSPFVDRPDEGSASRFALAAVVRLLAFPVLVAAAAIWLGPRRLGRAGDGRAR
jgi:nucleoside-diphosphate-sugar epimerase